MSIMFQEVPQDIIALKLSAEDYVKIESVKVSVDVTNVNASGDSRAEILAKLRKVVDTAWRFSRYSRTDDAGMERIQATAYARVKESDLNGVTTKIRELTSKGIEFEITDIDYSPTKEQTEAAMTGLRKKIYEKASKEAEGLNASIPAKLPVQPWRVGSITFDGAVITKLSALSTANSNNRGAMGATGAQGVTGPLGAQGGADDEDMSQKVAITASVNLYRIAWIAA